MAKMGKKVKPKMAVGVIKKTKINMDECSSAQEKTLPGDKKTKKGMPKGKSKKAY